MSTKTPSATTPQPYPLYVVAGPLGSGKTSLINALLEIRPREERWSILLNEAGRTEVHAEPRGPQVTVKDASGTCACCTGQVVFISTLASLIRQTRPHRVFVEADGRAALEPLVKAVQTSFNGAVELERVITLPGRSLVLASPEGTDDKYVALSSWPDPRALLGLLPPLRVAPSAATFSP